MRICLLVVSVLFIGVLAVATVNPAEAVPAFARQYDVRCNACHTWPPRLNRFGDQFHMMGFQIPSASRPDGLLGTLKEDGPVKTLLDSVAVRVVGIPRVFGVPPRDRGEARARPRGRDLLRGDLC
jgi:hypothetical protein